ncbi:hypothetical protein [Microbacterium panaciterrae]|uniref:DNA-binding protein n=1 Tax=Microbacterium panaciterrae TaxID=985759 RepID=A0ABP8PBN0_9MICO
MSNILDVLPGGLLTAAQVARRHGLCRESVNLAARRGELEAAVQLPGVNGARLFTEEAVTAWRSPGDRLAGL